jgi:hypothetical protein
MMDLWAYKNEVKIDFSRPGKPTDNAFCELFNGTFRSECLDTNWFTNLEDAKRLIEAWRREYNMSRPHRALDYRTPEEFVSQIAASRDLAETKQAENNPIIGTVLPVPFVPVLSLSTGTKGRGHSKHVSLKSYSRCLARQSLPRDRQVRSS